LCTKENYGSVKQTTSSGITFLNIKSIKPIIFIAVFLLPLLSFAQENKTKPFGIGRSILTNNWYYSDMAVKGEFNKLIGGKSQFFEVGAGLTYGVHAYMMFRLGYCGVF